MTDVRPNEFDSSADPLVETSGEINCDLSLDHDMA
jgi:hypothetical protein